MAGSQIAVSVTQVDEQRKGYTGVSLTNFTNDTTEPQIAAGSIVEIAGALFRFVSNETITGFAGLSNSTLAYLLLTVSGSSVTASWTATPPTWDAAKQGWYTGTNRVIGTIYKDGSGNPTAKALYASHEFGQRLANYVSAGGIGARSFRPEVLSVSASTTLTSADPDYIVVDASGGDRTITLPPLATVLGRIITVAVSATNTRVNAVTVDGAGSETINGNLTAVLRHDFAVLKILATAGNWVCLDGTFYQTFTVDIGDWNMDTTDSVVIDLGTLNDTNANGEKMAYAHAQIRADAAGANFALNGVDSPLAGTDTRGSVTLIADAGGPNGILLERVRSTFFDSATFNDTSYNRGSVTITYRVA